MCVLENMPERIPKSGTFELTPRCNLRCKICLFRQKDSKNNWMKKNEKTAKEWIDMAKQVAEAGTLELLLTGGEVMLRPDFCEIYEGIYKLGFVIQLYTNATLVDDKIIETLKKYPPHKIGVTLYGASPETYKKVCGNSDAFYRAIAGIKRLNQLPSVLEIRTTLIKDNVQDIDKIEEIAKQIVSPDANVIHSEYVLKAVRGGDCDVENCRLTPRENLNLMLRRSDKKINQF
ncbi:MAG: radical SAM protein, partial [Intestinibacter sp.]